MSNNIAATKFNANTELGEAVFVGKGTDGYSVVLTTLGGFYVAQSFTYDANGNPDLSGSASRVLIQPNIIQITSTHEVELNASGGYVSIDGIPVLREQQTILDPSGITDLASAIEAINSLATALAAHGLVTW